MWGHSDKIKRYFLLWPGHKHQWAQCPVVMPGPPLFVRPMKKLVQIIHKQKESLTCGNGTATIFMTMSFVSQMICMRIKRCWKPPPKMIFNEALVWVSFVTVFTSDCNDLTGTQHSLISGALDPGGNWGLIINHSRLKTSKVLTLCCYELWSGRHHIYSTHGMECWDKLKLYVPRKTFKTKR